MKDYEEILDLDLLIIFNTIFLFCRFVFEGIFFSKCGIFQIQMANRQLNLARAKGRYYSYDLEVPGLSLQLGLTGIVVSKSIVRVFFLLSQ